MADLSDTTLRPDRTCPPLPAPGGWSADGWSPEGWSPGDGAGAVDPHDARIASRAPAVLVPFNLAGVLAPADVHGAHELCELTGEDHPDVLLAAALALRAPRFGHVCIGLSGVADTVTGIEDAPVPLEDLSWPDPPAWREAVASSALVSVRPVGTPTPDPLTDRPLTLVGDRLYLDRYWRYERRVAEVLRRRAERIDEHVDVDGLRVVLDRLVPPDAIRPDRQRLAVATAALRSLTVIAGGPGTGKTHTVARILAALMELAGDQPLRVAVAAPTGKAADRLSAALRKAADELHVSDPVRDRLRSVTASTLHRLLGYAPGRRTRFAHDRGLKLPYQVVVVDETSMVDLPLMAKLVQALRTDAKLVLVGDPDQLASVEAGAVLTDIVGPSDTGLRLSPPARAAMAEVTGEPLTDAAPARPHGIDDTIVVLGTVHRYRTGSGIDRLAKAIHAGDGDAAVAVLRDGAEGVAWIDAAGDAVDGPTTAPVHDLIVGWAADVHAAANRGASAAALDTLDRMRVLTALRRGPSGASGWVRLVERWLAARIDGFDPTARWGLGRPLMITRNEPRLGLWNGDVGVVVRDGAHARVAFSGSQGLRHLAPSRLEDVESVYALTIHKSQGSQFQHVVVVLPDEDSPILSRELLYTAVTRTTGGVTVLGTEAAVRAAVARRVSRASGLRETLWGSAPPPGA